MRIGPIAVLRSETLSKLQEKENFLTEENARLAVELGTGSTLHSFMHYPWNAKTAPQMILEPDQSNDKSKNAIKRIIEAYNQSQVDFQSLSGSSMWNGIEERQKPFIQALIDRDEDTLHSIFSNMFQSDIMWGLGKFDNVLVEDMKRVKEKSHVQLRVTDALVSFAQASSAMSLVNVEQDGIEKNVQVLSQDLKDLLRKSEMVSNIKLPSPKVGASYGCEIDGEFITIDGIQHSYSVLRLLQLGARPADNIIEIGGGFGSLAYHSHLAGLKNFTIYDLPWVNAIQGYYLLMTLPADQVCLYKENTASTANTDSTKVFPYWCFDDLKDRSVDFVINCDSMPEMSRETCQGYLEKIKTALKGVFLSINQESKAPNGNGGYQNSVPEILEQIGGLRRTSRSIYWMRQGFVEEVYAPDSDSG